MKISFVIPAFNEEKNLPVAIGAIESEILRNSADCEIIVVNNGSTDGTEAVALSYPNVRVVTEMRKGIARARQAGLSFATGELIANVDADTRMPEGWLAFVLQKFNTDKKLVALSGPMIYYDVPSHVKFLWDFFYRVGYLAYLFNYFLLKHGAMLQGGNYVVKRSAIMAIGGYDKDLAYWAEDVDIAKRIITEGKVEWTFQLPMHSSGRRIQSEGALVLGLKYGINYCWQMAFARPFHHEQSDVREGDEKPAFKV